MVVLYHFLYILYRKQQKKRGFYRVEYGNGTAEDIFKVRKDIGIVAGPIIENNKITSGIVEKDGTCPYAGLPAKFSGYIHRMALQQNCNCVDARNAVVRPELMEDIKNRNYKEGKINLDLMQENTEYRILYDPHFIK